MTALLAAMFVEEGKIRWNSTVSEVFPEFSANMDPRLRRVTLEQLLSHTSGIPSDNTVFGDLLAKSTLQDGNLDELRYWLGSAVERPPAESGPGDEVRLCKHELRDGGRYHRARRGQDLG